MDFLLILKFVEFCIWIYEVVRSLVHFKLKRLGLKITALCCKLITIKVRRRIKGGLQWKNTQKPWKTKLEELNKSRTRSFLLRAQPVTKLGELRKSLKTLGSECKSKALWREGQKKEEKVKRSTNGLKVLIRKFLRKNPPKEEPQLVIEE